MLLPHLSWPHLWWGLSSHPSPHTRCVGAARAATARLGVPSARSAAVSTAAVKSEPWATGRSCRRLEGREGPQVARLARNGCAAKVAVLRPFSAIAAPEKSGFLRVPPGIPHPDPAIDGPE